MSVKLLFSKYCFHLQKHVTQPSVPSTKDKLSSNSLSSSTVASGVSRNEGLSSVEPLHPPPGVTVPANMNQVTSSSSSGFTTVTMSGTGKPLSHTSKFLLLKFLVFFLIIVTHQRVLESMF